MGVDARMLVRGVKQGQVSQKRLDELSYLLAASFDIIWHSQKWKIKALEFVNEYEQDGEPIVGNKDEALIKVNLTCRYYGEDYARGPILDIINVAEWLEHHIKGAQVYYGGDSSCICAEPFNKEHRDRLKEFYFDNYCFPYISVFDRNNRQPTCSFCQQPIILNCWGGSLSAGKCQACEERVCVDSNGTVLVRTIEDGEGFDILNKGREILNKA